MNYIKRYNYYLFLIIVCMWMSCCSSAQEFTSRIYTANDGLTDSNVGSIFQDSKGFLWIGTGFGLNRFNGYQFTSYGVSNALPALAGSLVLEDHKHRLWMATPNGPMLLEGNKSHYLPTNDSLKIKWVFSIRQMPDKKIWAFTDVGIYEYADSCWKKIWLIYPYLNRPTRQIITRKEGTYINYGNEIVLLLNNGRYHSITPLQKDAPYYIYVQEFLGNLYVNTPEGIFKIIDQKLFPVFRKPYDKEFAFTFFIDSKKRCWAALEKHGIMVSAPGDEKGFTAHIPSDVTLTSVFAEDDEGNIWASNFEGLMKIKESFAQVYSKKNAPLIRDTRLIVKTPEGKLFFSSSANGLLEYNGSGFSRSKILPGYLSNEVMDAYTYDNQKRLWIISRAGHLYFSESGIIREAGPLIDSSNKWLYDIAYHPQHACIYISSEKLLKNSGRGFKDFIAANTKRSVYSPRKILVSPNGNMLVATRDSGVYLIDLKSNCYNVSQQLGLPQVAPIVQLFNDPDGGIWISYPGGGLKKFRWNKDNSLEKLIDITTANGLPNNYICSVCFDHHHRLWAATLSGLVLLDVSREGDGREIFVHRVDQEFGVKVDNWIESRLMTDWKGDVWLSSFHEIIKFEAKKIQIKSRAPRLIIEDVSVRIKPGKWKMTSGHEPDSLKKKEFSRLSYYENTINVNLKAISYSGRDKLYFSYRLEGNSNEWSDPSTNDFVTLTNLPPGKYSLFAKAKINDSRWSEPVIYSFTIDEPYWQQLWFRLLTIIAASLLLLLFFWLRLRKIRQSVVIQKKLQTLELKALKAQMNPHFIYNALNSIQSLVIDNKKKDTLRYVSKFAKLLRQVLEHSENNVINLGRELEILDLYIQIELLRLDFTFTYTVNVTENIDKEKEMVPSLLLQPFVENALWHGLSHKIGDKRLCIEIDKTEKLLVCKIRDNGVGRRASAQFKKAFTDASKSKGIEITRSRLKLYNESDNLLPIIIQDLKDEKGCPAGTSVTISIKRKQFLQNENK